MAVLQNVHLLKQPYQLMTPRVLWGFLKFFMRRLSPIPLDPMPSVPALPAETGN
jgi:hypothetical protein